MKIVGRGGIDVSNIGTIAVVSKTPKDTAFGFEQQNAIPAPPDDPFTGISFYSYANGQNVVIVGGQVIVRVPAVPSGAFASLDGGIPTTTFSTLIPGTTGYIIFKYAQSLSQQILTNYTVQDADVDFGDPSTNYFVQLSSGSRFTNKESNTVNGLRYGFVFSPTAPEPSRSFFQHIICRVEVAANGAPTVYPVHLGNIDVPLGYFAWGHNFLVEPND